MKSSGNPFNFYAEFAVFLLCEWKIVGLRKSKKGSWAGEVAVLKYL